MGRGGSVRFWIFGSMLLIGVWGQEPKSERHDEHGGGSNVSGISIVSLEWEYVEPPYLVALWILVCFLCKLVIEANHHVTEFIPESALLICSGFILGGMIWGADKVQTFRLTPYDFFHYFLPPIILDTGYSMPNKLFFTNLGGILIHAIIGTCWNAASLGLSLWGCQIGGAMGDLNVGLLQYLLFGSLIAAVDPVAVLAVFEQVHVNEVLFIMVFGESLLNDGVTVVLFNVFNAFVTLGGPRINAAEIIKGISETFLGSNSFLTRSVYLGLICCLFPVSFFVVAFGGSLVGFVFGLLFALLSRCTKNIQIIEPGFLFILGYLAYLTAEMLSLSAILSIVFFGVCCQKYINANMDENSVRTMKCAVKVFANGAETMIFVFLGISAIDKSIWVWNTGFVLLTLLFILIYRFMGEALGPPASGFRVSLMFEITPLLFLLPGVFFLTWFMNLTRLVPIDYTDQVIMSYGGLRGAVAYGLAVMLDEAKIEEKKLMVSTTLIVVYFTVILQGVTMKPLVKWLKVKRAASAEKTLIEKVQNRAFEHILVAIEDISGQKGNNYLRNKWFKFEENWMSRILLRPSVRERQDKVFNVFHQLNLKDAMSYVVEGERRGSLEFIRNESAFVDFKKKFGEDMTMSMPDIMADMSDDRSAASSTRKESVPSVSLEVHEQAMRGTRAAEGLDSHHLLQQHLYKGRKQHRHRYSRSHFDINKDENEIQEIFQRTMKSRLESFKSGKMGVAPPKTITKHTRKEQQQKVRTAQTLTQQSVHPLEKDKIPRCLFFPNPTLHGKTLFQDFRCFTRFFRQVYNIQAVKKNLTFHFFWFQLQNKKSKSRLSGDEDFEFSEGDSASGYDTSFPVRGGYRPGAGIENPAFMPDVDLPLQIPPWLEDVDSVAPSQRAQVRLPWTPSNLRRLSPLRISTRSSDSFNLAEAPGDHQDDQLPPPPTPPPHRDGDVV
ncbi:transcript variant X2 [Nothobranchius furzeri]|uniref:Sodium/hydrogen exchanger n=1 Tax=Nothobranchius furzeri TaxID=105023 RepID=A0A9D2XZI7_NOTFU|nr:sodium/hydrogen exchanger 3 isoform X2 [Nothobranchius furzeri]KAF7211424.1 transcript variant X2 [Nothobranchius furzeri]